MHFMVRPSFVKFKPMISFLDVFSSQPWAELKPFPAVLSISNSSTLGSFYHSRSSKHQITMADFPRNLHGLGDFPTIFPAFSPPWRWLGLPPCVLGLFASVRAWRWENCVQRRRCRRCAEGSTAWRGCLERRPSWRKMWQIASSWSSASIFDFPGRPQMKVIFTTICLYVYTNNHI